MEFSLSIFDYTFTNYYYWMLKRGDSGIFSPIIGDDKLINHLHIR